MPIYIVKGPDGEALRTVAACLRSVFVNNNKGAIIVDHRDTLPELPAEATEEDKAAAVAQQTKAKLQNLLTNPEALNVEGAEYKWLANAAVVVVNDKEETLEAFEKIAPGFRERFAPVVTVTVEEEASAVS